VMAVVMVERRVSVVVRDGGGGGHLLGRV